MEMNAIVTLILGLTQVDNRWATELKRDLLLLLLLLIIVNNVYQTVIMMNEFHQSKLKNEWCSLEVVVFELAHVAADPVVAESNELVVVLELEAESKER